MTLILAVLSFTTATTLGSGAAAILWARAGHDAGRTPEHGMGYDIRTW